MFAPPECVMEGELPVTHEVSFSSIHCDHQGGVWAVDLNGTRVFRFPGPAAMESAQSPGGTSNLSELYFECTHDTEGRVLAVVFTTVRGQQLQQQMVACVATTTGCLVFGNVGQPNRVTQRVELGSEITAVVAGPLGKGSSPQRPGGADNDDLEVSSVCHDGCAGEGGVLVSSFDGTYSEVLYVRCNVGNSEEEPQPQDYDVDMVGLFRVQGRVCGLMVDETCERVVTVNEHGDVDVWNWQRGVDETASFGMPAYPAADYGVLSCCVLLGGFQLWIGTSRGFVVVFCLERAEDDSAPEDINVAITRSTVDGTTSGASKGAPQRTWRAHGDAAVRSLLVLSVGRFVWSYGADQQAHVWDATELVLRGSLQFPCESLSELRGGDQRLETIVWGVCGGSGKVTQFRVREPLPFDGQSLLFARDNHTAREQMERYGILNALVAHLCSLLRPIYERIRDSSEKPLDDEDSIYLYRSSGEGDESDGDPHEIAPLFMPPHADLALKQLESCHPTARYLPHAIASLVAGHRVASQLRYNNGRRGPTTFLEDLRFFQRRQQEEAHILHSLRLEADEERRARRDVETRLMEREEEVRDQQQRIEQSAHLHEEYERRLATLKRELKSAKSRAAVTSAGASRLTEMESSLHEAHCTVQGLQERLEGLMRERQHYLRVSEENKSLQALVRRFELKQQMAKRVIANFMATQDHVIDALADIVETSGTASDRAVRKDISGLHEWLCRNVEVQREFLSSLKRSYEASLDNPSEDSL
uniref:Uncharacterized protein n=1 Tax=Trypanosoma congolense (strain IL3000) TaxID=1068625 RepID=G0UIS1_TRYCI|nr:conserved hypothetical protein [Trypanosoma congolense IL3000]